MRRSGVSERKNHQEEAFGGQKEEVQKGRKLNRKEGGVEKGKKRIQGGGIPRHQPWRRGEARNPIQQAGGESEEGGGMKKDFRGEGRGISASPNSRGDLEGKEGGFGPFIGGEFLAELIQRVPALPGGTEKRILRKSRVRKRKALQKRSPQR